MLFSELKNSFPKGTFLKHTFQKIHLEALSKSLVKYELLLKSIFSKKLISQTQTISHQKYFIKSTLKKNTVQIKLIVEAWPNRLLVPLICFANDKCYRIGFIR